MKIKAIAFVSSILLSGTINAQLGAEITSAEKLNLMNPGGYYFTFNYGTMPTVTSKSTKEQNKDKGFKSIKSYVLNEKSNEKELIKERAYDNEGRVTKNLNYSKNKYSGYYINYNLSGNKEKQDNFKKSKFIHGVEFSYTQKGDVESIKNYYKSKDSYNYLTLLEYNENGRVTRRERHDKNGNRLLSLYKYEYNTDGDKATTYRYYKGKLKAKYSFKCDGSGADIKKKVEKEICTKSEFDKDGNRIEVTRKLNHKGEAIKSIFTYNSKNQLFKYERFDKNEDIIKMSIHTLDENGNILTTKVYNKGKTTPSQYYEYKYNEKGIRTYAKRIIRGKTYEQQVTFDANGNITKRIYKDKKSEYAVNYVFDKKNNLTSTNSDGLKNDYSKIFTYDENNNRTSYTYKDKKHESKSIIEYEFH